MQINLFPLVEIISPHASFLIPTVLRRQKSLHSILALNTFSFFVLPQCLQSSVTMVGRMDTLYLSSALGFEKALGLVRQKVTDTAIGPVTKPRYPLFL